VNQSDSVKDGLGVRQRPVLLPREVVEQFVTCPRVLCTSPLFQVPCHMDSMAA
jgi:hypothetical protein